MSEEIFLTGVTGFVGSGLLQKWLTSSDAVFHLLARGRRNESPQKRIENLLGELFPDADVTELARRIEILEGDLALNDLGLEKKTYQRLGKRVTHIIHCAAAARFDLDLEEARRINVGGTERALAMARSCQRLEKFDYIGTAYVAGRRGGLIREEELDEGQQFNNTYEQTKLEAEQRVRESQPQLPVTIFRPSIVICDSRTGRMSRHSAFYRLLQMYLLGRLKMLPGDPSCFLDLVPIDYMVDAAFLISSTADSTGKCYQLTAGLDNLTTLGELQDLAGRHFCREKFSIIPPEQFIAYVSQAKGSFSEEELGMIEEFKIYLPYLTAELKFDNSNTLKALKNKGLLAPRVSSYFDRMAEYMLKHANV
jgi:thioester reductase-like protein